MIVFSIIFFMYNRIEECLKEFHDTYLEYSVDFAYSWSIMPITCCIADWMRFFGCNFSV